jgi:predicted dehydrogenase
MRVVIIGLGSIAKKHIAALRDIDRKTEIYALRSGFSKHEEPGVSSFYELEQVSRIDPDFILLSNPTSERGEVLKKLVGLGKPLFIEKPALSSLKDADMLQAAFTKNELLTYVACNLRFHACLVFMKNYLSTEQPQVNEVNIYCGSYLPGWRPGQDFRKTYSALPDLGGGVHLDLIHEIDYAYWIFGAPTKSSSLLRSASSLDIASVDYANYQLVHPRFTINAVLNYYRRDYKRTLEVVTDEETISVDIAANTVTSSVQGVLFSSKATILDTYLEQMKYFVSLLQDSTLPNMNSFSEGVEVLKIILDET